MNSSPERGRSIYAPKTTAKEQENEVRKSIRSSLRRSMSPDQQQRSGSKRLSRSSVSVSNEMPTGMNPTKMRLIGKMGENNMLENECKDLEEKNSQLDRLLGQMEEFRSAGGTSVLLKTTKDKDNHTQARMVKFD
jgi:hypothetical protein